MRHTFIRLLLLTVCLPLSHAHAQSSPYLKWGAAFLDTYSVPTLGILPTATALDAHGNVYITGNFIGTVDFDPGPGVASVTATQPFDAFICKLDARGAYVWAKAVPSGNGQPANGIAVDRQGDIYIAGNFTGTIDADPGSATYNLNAVNGSQDIYVLKLDANGSFIWARAMGGKDYDFLYGMAVDGAGSVYTTGTFTDTADFDPSPTGVAKLVAPVSAAYTYVSKLDSAGNYVWANMFTGGVIGYAVAADDSGSVYTTGGFGGTVDFDPGPATALVNSVGSSALFICKLTSNGVYQWVKAGVQANYGVKLALDGAGNIYTTGSFAGTVDFDPGPGTTYLTALGPTGHSMYILKLNAAGNYSWAKTVGGSRSDQPINIAVDAQRSVYTTGYFSDSADFDPGGGIARFRCAGDLDAFICKLDSNGSYVWAGAIGGTNRDDGLGLAVASSGDVYCAGSFMGTADLDPGTGQYLVNTGNRSGYVVRLSDCSSRGLAMVNSSATLTTMPVGGNSLPLHFAAACADIASLLPVGTSRVQGKVTASVYIAGTALVDSSRVYVRRHYDVDPAAGAATASARLTLYFTQADFDNYNTSSSSVHLPTGPGDAAGIARLRIRQEHGSSATGLPGSYTGWSGSAPAIREINPADSDVVWNSSAARWEVSFDVTGFSGFFAYGAIDTALTAPHLPRDNSFTVMPQPATENLIIRCSDAGMYEKQAIIYDMRGVTTACFRIQNIIALDIRSWSPGAYSMRLPNGVVMRLLKQ